MGDDEEARKAHGKPGYQRVQETGGRDRDRCDVVDESPCEVAADGPQSVSRQPNGVWDDPEMVAYADDVGAAHRDISAGDQCHAEIGACQGSGVVDAVTYHGYHAAFRAKSLNDLGFVGG